MRRWSTATTIAAVAIVAGGFAPAARWPETLASVLVGAAWFGGVRRGWEWSASAGFLALVGLTALGALSGLPALWALVAVVAALAALDLSVAALRLGRGQVIGEDTITKARLRRLAPVAGIGLATGLLASSVHLSLGFVWLLLLGLVALVGLAAGVRALRRPLEEDQ
jgi:hypothetical protein